MTATEERIEVFFSGHVQGVGFRYRTAQVAAGFAVVGYVRNLPDGRVEVVVEGERAELQRFVREVELAMSGYIREKRTATYPATGEFTGFEIRR